MPLASRTGNKVSHYLVEDLLGSGGMGAVYRGIDLRLKRRVAMKFLRPLSDPASHRQLLNEAQAASSLDHPNICTIFEVDEDEHGEIFIAMALYDGETLDRMISRGPVELEKALAVAIQTGRGLAAAHEERIVHQDVKPGNIMLTQSGMVKILDFGISRNLDDPFSTDDGRAVGTPAYMSPEKLRGRPVDERADIWSLGVVLYEMVTGSVPFLRKSVAGTIEAVLHEQLRPASAVSPAVPGRVDRIIAKALSKDPQFRYQHMEGLVQDLLKVQPFEDSVTLRPALVGSGEKAAIAVLPFEDMSPAKDQEYLCDGIAEEILRALSRIPSLHVASRTSAFQFKRRAVDIREIGARLNVDSVLEGSVRRADDRIRISVQLVSVDTGYRLWDERYDRDMRDLFTIQDEISEHIAHALEVKLAGQVEKPSTQPPLPDAGAYELYLQGRQFFHQHRRKALEIALQNFSRAMEVDPGYARAYAGIADCQSFLHLYFGKGREAVSAAEVASAKALEIDRDLPEAHASRGLALFLSGEFDQAEQHLRRALDLNPRLYDSHYIFGRVCFSRGRHAEAAAHFRKACILAPEAYDSWYLLGMCHRKMGDSDKARSADLECLEAVRKCIRYHPDDTRGWTMGAGVLAEIGDRERAAAWVARALAVDPDEPIVRYNAACVYATLGRHDDAIACLEVISRQRSIAKDWLENDPDLDPLRSDPRLQALLARMDE